MIIIQMIVLNNVMKVDGPGWLMENEKRGTSVLSIVSVLSILEAYFGWNSSEKILHFVLTLVDPS